MTYSTHEPGRQPGSRHPDYYADSIPSRLARQPSYACRTHNCKRTQSLTKVATTYQEALI